MTSQLAATAAHAENSGTAVLGALLLIGFVLFAITAHFADLPCRAPLCKGGKVPNPIGRGTRPCGRCGGRGKKTRLARKVWDRMMRGSRR